MNIIKSIKDTVTSMDLKYQNHCIDKDTVFVCVRKPEAPAVDKFLIELKVKELNNV